MRISWSDEGFYVDVSAPGVFDEEVGDVAYPEVHTDEINAEFERFEAELAEARKDRVCRWNYHDDGLVYYVSACGNTSNWSESPKYCPDCGGKVEVDDE